MWRTNLKVLFATLAVVGFYTGVAHIIPQLESEVPETLALTGDVSAEQLVSAGERMYNGAGGCTACHGLGTRAPNLLTDHAGQGPIGARCGSRRPGMDCKAYLYESMVEPNKHVVAGFEPIMPDMRRSMSNDQIWATIAFLQAQGGEATVTADDIRRTGGAPTAGGGGGGATQAPAGPAMTTTTDPTALFAEKGCIGCHQLGGQGGQVGPPLDAIGRQRNADYIRRSLLEPNADTARGFERFAGTMPAFGQQLTAAQLEALVRFLASRR
ncbi:MAG: c-type cytochrome [Gemmatimonadaceae bacterium]